MSLTYTELQSVTDDYYKTDGGKAFDIYFNTSFFSALASLSICWDHCKTSGQVRFEILLRKNLLDPK